MKIKFTQDSRQKDNSIIVLIIAGSLVLTGIIAIYQHNIELQKVQVIKTRIFQK